MNKSRIISLLVLLVSLSLIIGGVALILFATPIQNDVLPTLAGFPQSEVALNNTHAALPVANRHAATLPPPSQVSNLSAQSQPVPVSVPAESVPEQMVLTFAADASAEDRQAYIASIGGVVAEDVEALNTVVVNIPTSPIAFDPPPSPLVVESEPNYYVVAQHTTAASDIPNDPRLAEQWALPLIGALDTWHHINADIASVTVAVIDSGICEHPELNGRVLVGYDFVEDDTNPQDEFGHGCGVAGILAANSNDGIGMAGAAAHIQIMPLRVLDRSGIGTYAQVAAAIVYAVDNGAEIINISLGGTNASTTLQNAVDYATDHDVLLIAAAGNAGAQSVLYPAAYDNVVAVGSIDQNLERSSFSNYGSDINLWAPGRDILATNISGSYSLMSGTSFAAPHVAAVAALEKALGSSLIINGNIVAVGGTPLVDITATPPAATLTPGGPTLTPNAAMANNLFADASAQGALSMDTNLGVIRSRYTDVNFGAISQTGAQGVSPQSALSDPMTLNLFDDVTLTTVFDNVENHELTGNGFVWIGHIEGHPEDSETVLVVGNGQLAGYVRTLGKLYQITYAGNGVHAINEISEQTFADRHINPIVPEGLEALEDNGETASPDVNANGFAQIDLMVLYTAKAMDDVDGLGGEDATQNAIQLAVAAVNQAYVRSGVNARLNLTHSGFLDYTETQNDCGGGVGCKDIYNISNTEKSLGQAVDTLRSTYHADIVTLITNDNPSYCGLGFQMAGDDQPSTGFSSYAFNIVWSECLPGGRTLAHEIGHNMGAAHDYVDRRQNTGLYNDSYGYSSPNSAFHTIMSYGRCPSYNPCTAVSRFSNRNQTFGGLPLGDANADNVRTLNLTAPIAARFRLPYNSNVEPTATPVGNEPTATPVQPLPTPGPAPQCTVNIINGDTNGLINAINTANTNSNPDTICLATGGLYTASSGLIVNGFLTDRAFPQILTSINIVGNGATIQKTGSAKFRFFDILSSGTLQIDDLTLKDGSSSLGGAIYVYGGTLVVTNSSFLNNIATGNGGAIYAYGGTTTIYDSYFLGNAAQWGGGVAVADNGNLFIATSNLSENSAEYGGAVFAYRMGTVQISTSCLINNSPNAVYNDRDGKTLYYNPPTPPPTASIITATNNWWGSIRGPSLIASTTTGDGDYISNNVTYDPYQLRPSAVCLPRPNAPLVVSPISAALISISQPTIQWTAVADAINYEFELANNSYFTNAQHDNSAGTSYVTPSLSDGKYYWRVRAYNGGLFSPWSRAFSFTIDTTAPSAPLLDTPDDDMVTVNTQPDFGWNRNSDAGLYEFHITGPVIDEQFFTATNGYILPNLLLPGFYDWSVRGQDAAGNWSAWSDVFSFEVRSDVDVAPELPLFTTLTPTLTWSEITWARAFHIQIATDAAFISLLEDDNTIPSAETSFTPAELLPGRYYWRVRVQNQNGAWSKWSATDSFWVSDGDPLNP